MRRRLAAGDSKRGGGARDRRSGDHSGGGDHPREAQTRARLGVHAGGCGGGGARRSRARGGGRSSGASGNGLRGTGRPPEGLGGTLVAPGARWGARFGRRRAETTTATWTAARGFGRGGEEGYGVRAAKRREGNGGGAHRGCSGRRSGLGDALETAGRRWGSTAAGDEEDDGVGDGARPWSLGSSRTMRTTRRSF